MKINKSAKNVKNDNGNSLLDFFFKLLCMLSFLSILSFATLFSLSKTRHINKYIYIIHIENHDNWQYKH